MGPDLASLMGAQEAPPMPGQGDPVAEEILEATRVVKALIEEIGIEGVQQLLAELAAEGEGADVPPEAL